MKMRVIPSRYTQGVWKLEYKEWWWWKTYNTYATKAQAIDAMRAVIWPTIMTNSFRGN